MSKLILVCSILFLTSCSFKRVCYVAWGDASRSNTSVQDDSKKENK